MAVKPGLSETRRLQGGETAVFRPAREWRELDVQQDTSKEDGGKESGVRALRRLARRLQRTRRAALPEEAAVHAEGHGDRSAFIPLKWMVCVGLQV